MKHFDENHYNGISYTMMGATTSPTRSCRRKAAPSGGRVGCTKLFYKSISPSWYNDWLLSGKLWTYLADPNKQAGDRLACNISQMQTVEGPPRK